MKGFRGHLRLLRRLARDYGATAALGLGLGVLGFFAYARAERAGVAFAAPPPAAISAEYAEVRPARRAPFRNCAAARAAGAAPVYRGDPGYGAHLDADDDGAGCEPLYR
jgi:hypothetical protein